jgi:hypothetical protein
MGKCVGCLVHWRKNGGKNSHEEASLEQISNTDLRAGHQWLTPVILATQEAEMGRSQVKSQPRQIVHETLSQKTYYKKGLVEWL